MYRSYNIWVPKFIEVPKKKKISLFKVKTVGALIDFPNILLTLGMYSILLFVVRVYFKWPIYMKWRWNCKVTWCRWRGYLHQFSFFVSRPQIHRKGFFFYHNTFEHVWSSSTCSCLRKELCKMHHYISNCKREIWRLNWLYWASFQGTKVKRKWYLKRSVNFRDWPVFHQNVRIQFP